MEIMMDYARLLPSPDAIPASPWVFWTLGVLTFMVHIVLVNALLGGSVIALFTRIRGGSASREPIHGPITGKLPSITALAINFGVAPLLFIQVIYGTLYYTSSVLMAVFKLLVIPLLIAAYYGVYAHKKLGDSRKILATALLACAVIIFLYIALLFAGNLTLMVRPGEWTSYFGNRGGTYFPARDLIIYPRLAHFITASIAVGGLALALLWNYRDNGRERALTGLRIYAIATLFQFAVGPWYLFSQQDPAFEALTGDRIGYAAVLAAGILTAFASVTAAFKGRIFATCAFFICTMTAMTFTRANVRIVDTAGFFTIESLPLKPQYGPMFLFILFLVLGAAVIFYLVKKALVAGRGGDAR